MTSAPHFDGVKRCDGSVVGPTESCSGLFGSDDRPVAYMELTGRNDQIGDRQLQQMTYQARLEWAADERGRLTDRSKLKRIARDCGYAKGWVGKVAERNWQEVVAEARQYRRDRTIWPSQRNPESLSAKGYLRSQFALAWRSYVDAANDDGTALQPHTVRHLRSV
jgi:hypothetical protein